MNILRVRTGAVLTVFTTLGLLAGCSGGGSPAAVGGKSGTAGANGAGGGAAGHAGTQGAAGTPGVGGAVGIGGSGVGGGAAGSGMAGGAGGTTAAGGKGGTTGVGGAAGGGKGGGGGAAGGSTSAGGSTGAGGAGNSNTKWGIIIVDETAQTFVAPAPIGTLAVIASGGQATFGVSAGGDNCPSTTSGDCQVFDCAPKPTTTTPAPTYFKAGDVTVTGLLTTPLALTWGGIPGTLMSYMSAPLSTYLWTASRPATVTVTGSADVPAFTMGVTAPNPIVITNPVSTLGTTGSTYTISKAGALNVTWSGGVDGMVTVDLTTGTTAAGQINIHCALDASKGMVTVPATFMAKLGASGGFTAGVTSFADKSVGDWMMHFQASSVRDNGTATFTN